MFVSPQKIRGLFLAKATIVPPTWLALLIWAFVKVPPKSGLFAQKSELSGSGLSWAWLSALNSAVGNFATLGVNIPDFTVGPNLPCHVALVYVRQTKSEICQERKSVGNYLSRSRPSSLTTLTVDLQTIYPTLRNICCVHISQLHRYCFYKCRYHPLRPYSLEPAHAHRPLGQPRCCFLHIFCICSRYSRQKRLGQFSERRE
jgi:hypothetical protein